MWYFWWGCRGNLTLITLRSERVKYKPGSTIIFHLSSYEKPTSPYCVMWYFWWGCRGNLTLITLGSERANLIPVSPPQINHSLPDRIVVFRDGVGDGQLPTVAGYEVQQLSECFALFGAGYQPRMAVVVVQKRINTRIFSIQVGWLPSSKSTYSQPFKDKMYKRSSENWLAGWLAGWLVGWSVDCLGCSSPQGNSRLDNPPPGTIIDHTITRKDWWVPHAPRNPTVSHAHALPSFPTPPEHSPALSSFHTPPRNLVLFPHPTPYSPEVPPNSVLLAHPRNLVLQPPPPSPVLFHHPTRVPPNSGLLRPPRNLVLEPHPTP